MLDFLKPLKQVVDKILWHSDLLSARFSIAVGSLFWTILLWWPGELFSPTRTTYRLMSQMTDETVWGGLFFIHVIFATFSIFTGLKNKIVFLGDALFGSLIWTIATVACFASHWQYGVSYAPPAAMSAELSLMFASWWWLIRWVVSNQQEKNNG